MLRTNSKKAIENIKAYIIEHFDGENYGIETPATFKEVATIIYNTFVNEVWEYSKAYYHFNELAGFEYWVSGLPSIIDTCYYYNRPAVDDLGDILEETIEERNRYSEQDAERVLTLLIYREIKKAVK